MFSLLLSRSFWAENLCTPTEWYPCNLWPIIPVWNAGVRQHTVPHSLIRKQQSPTVEHRSSTDLIGVPVSEIMARLLWHSNRLNWMAGALEHGDIISTTARIPHCISCSTRFSIIAPHFPLLLCSTCFPGISSFIAGTAVLLVGRILPQATCMERADFYKRTKPVSLTWINQTAQAGSMEASPSETRAEIDVLCIDLRLLSLCRCTFTMLVW